MRTAFSCLLMLALCCTTLGDESPVQVPAAFQTGEFRWRVGPKLLGPAHRPEDPCHSIKDPSVVFFNGRWHLFCTIRSKTRSHQIEYISFADWKDTSTAERHVLTLSDAYFCAPQVFFFRPHQRWYLIYQVIDQDRKPALQPAFSTTDDVSKPASWTKPKLLFEQSPENVSRWIDFWVICDESRAYLFFTSLDGRMWRADTRITDFPHGWSRPLVVLQGDIFEASHTYRLKGLDKYLTVIEAQNGSRRYYQANLANRLDGAWRPLAATREQPFASPINVRFTDQKWTDSFSHGELLRAGHDDRLEVDPNNMRFLFQGVSDEAQKGKKYGEIPYRLGLLEPAL